MKTLIAQQQINEMRDLGRAMTDKGLFEIDMATTRTTWMNEFSLGKIGGRVDQIQAMSLYDFFPEEFHDQLASNVASQTGGEQFRFSIWPMRASSGKVAWWYVVRLKVMHPFYWYKGEFLNITEKGGPEYSSMLAAMATTNSYNELFNSFIELRSSFSEAKQWTEQQVNRLDEKDQRIDAALSDLGEKIRGAVQASQAAAESAKDVKKAFVDFQQSVSERLASTAKEIVQLVTADALQEQRMAAVEAHLKKTTDTACQAIVTQANREGSKLAKRVVIPTAAIYPLVEIIKWIIGYFLHR